MIFLSNSWILLFLTVLTRMSRTIGDLLGFAHIIHRYSPLFLCYSLTFRAETPYNPLCNPHNRQELSETVISPLSPVSPLLTTFLFSRRQEVFFLDINLRFINPGGSNSDINPHFPLPNPFTGPPKPALSPKTVNNRELKKLTREEEKFNYF